MMERRKNGMLERWNVGMSSVVLLILTFQLSIIPTVLSAQRHSITFEDYIALKSVSEPQLSPDGKWVAYTVSTPSLQDNRNVSRVWVVEVATGKATNLTPDDHDVPAIATSGDGDVAISPDGQAIAVAMHGDSTVADNTNVDIYLIGPEGATLRPLSTRDERGADNTPRFSPDGTMLSWLSMERAGFEADRQRLMLLAFPGGRGRRPANASGQSGEATAGWNLSVGSYTWCPNSKCIYAIVEERGRDNIYRIEIPGFKRTRVVAGGVNTGVQVGPDNKTLAYLHQ